MYLLLYTWHYSNSRWFSIWYSICLKWAAAYTIPTSFDGLADHEKINRTGSKSLTSKAYQIDYVRR